jgi:hypothetical protein
MVIEVERKDNPIKGEIVDIKIFWFFATFWASHLYIV